MLWAFHEVLVKPLDVIAESLSNIALDGAFCEVAVCVGT
jgi:hypothetical protein